MEELPSRLVEESPLVTGGQQAVEVDTALSPVPNEDRPSDMADIADIADDIAPPVGLPAIDEEVAAVPARRSSIRLPVDVP